VTPEAPAPAPSPQFRATSLQLEAVEVACVDLGLRGPLARAGASISRRRGVRVQIRDRSGLTGLGEGLALPAAGTEPYAALLDAVRALARTLRDRSGTLEELLAWLDTSQADTPAARCGFDGALHDLAARMHGVPVAQSLAAAFGGAAAQAVAVNALLAADAHPDAAQDPCARGYRTLKLKVGAADARHELDGIRALRAGIGPEVRLRLDANGAWTAAEALARLEAIADCAIECIEQPTAPDDLDALGWLHARSPVPIAVDESLALPTGRERLLRGELGRFAIVKPMVLGGLTSAARLCRQAADAGIHCIVTTTLDGPVATASALHLAAACGSAAHAHGLAASEALATPFPTWLIPVDGQLRLDGSPGLGGDLEQTALYPQASALPAPASRDTGGRERPGAPPGSGLR